MILGNACNPALEKNNIPISFSFRLDNDFDYDLFIRDVYYLKQLGVHHFSVELILKNDSNNTPYLENIQSLNAVLYKLDSLNFYVHLIISKWNARSILVSDTLLEKWNLLYQQLLDTFILQLQPFKIVSLVYGVDFENIEKRKELYSDWLFKIQSKVSYPIFYSSSLFHTIDCQLHEYSDFIGIFYEQAFDDRYKKLARELHPKISQKFKNKKIIITHANIQGKDAKLQFQNLLRFWVEDNIQLININSIYNQSVMSRNSVYFSLKEAQSFKEYLSDYLTYH